MAPQDTIFAALDLGTNNCRLLIASAENGHSRVLETFSRVVRLGEGLSKTGTISENAMLRAVEAIRICARKMSRYELLDGRYVATEACRRAINYQDFIERVKRETGLLLEVIPHEEEAKLAFHGCSALLDTNAQHAIVIDIGGGSTECMWAVLEGEKSTIEDWSSFSFGVMNLTERYSDQTKPRESFHQITQIVAKHIEAFEFKNRIREKIAASRVQMLCSSGTVTTIAGVYLDLPRYDRSQVDGTTISSADIRRTIETIVTTQEQGNPFHPCIGEDRVEFMLAGCAIMQAILDVLPVTAVTIGDRGVREGIIMTLMDKHGLR